MDVTSGVLNVPSVTVIVVLSIDGAYICGVCVCVGGHVCVCAYNEFLFNADIL